MGKALDVMGKEISLGDTVVRATMYGNSASMTVCKVTKIEGVYVWLDSSPKAIIYNDRLAVVETSV